MAKLFVSYSRKDHVAARKLIEAFKSIEQEVWVDWESIPPAVDWLEQIFRGIEEADAFVFLISPDSIASEVCKVEIGHATQNNKRIIPIVLRDVNPKDTIESIRKLNWTFLRESDPFEEGLAKVKTAVELDLDWLEEHRRLQVRALEWHRKKDISLLLRGRDLRNAERMIATATSKDPPTTDLQKTFILYSRRTERSRTIAWVAAVITLIVLSALTYTAIQQSRLANANEKLAKANEALALQNEQVAQQNERLARTNEAEANAQRAIAEENKKIAEAQRSAARAQIYQTRPGELYTSTLLAIDSWQKNPSDESEEILRKNISLLPLPVAQVSQAGNINAMEFSPNGDGTSTGSVQRFVTASVDGTTCAWDAAAGKKLFCATSLGPVTDAAFSLDGSMIVTGDESGQVQILDAKTGNLETQFKYDAPVRKVNIRSDGRLLAVARQDGKITIVDLKTHKESYNLKHGGPISVTAFSPNGTWLAVGSPTGTVTLWNLGTGKIASQPSHRAGVLAIAFSPDNKTIVTGGKDNTALVSQIATGFELLRIPNENWIRDVAFSPDGSWFVTVSDDKRIRVWDTTSGKERLRMLQDSIVTEVRVSLDGQWIATTGSDKTVRVWNAATGAELFQIPLNASGAQLAFNGDGKYLVSSDQRGAINIWDISVMATSEKYMQFNGIVSNVRYSPSGKKLVVSDENRIWLLTPEPLSLLTTRPQGVPLYQFKSNVKDVLFSPDSKLLGIRTEGNEVAIYDIANRWLKNIQVSNPIQSIAFSPDSQQFLTSDSDGNVQAWSAFNGDGKYLVSSDQRGAINIWDISVMATSEKYMQFNGIVSNVRYSPSGKKLVVSDENRIWLLTPEPLSLLTARPQGAPLYQFKSNVRDVLFSPDSKFLGIRTEGNEIAVYDIASRWLKNIQVSNPIQSIAFSPDSQQFLTSDSDGNVQVWSVFNAELIDQPDEKHTEVSSFAASSGLLAIGSKDSLTIVDTSEGGATQQIESPGKNALLVFSQDGSLLASTDSSGKINIWKDQNGAFTALTSFVKEQATSLAFNPAGTLLAAGTAKNVYLIDPNTGEEVARIPHIDIVNGVSFSADGTMLATASSKVLQFWNIKDIQQIKRDHLVPAACSRLLENFDAAQWQALFGDEQYRTLCENLPIPK